jgi:pimeloyl-ACP methyl ester carboxylesterase
MLCRRGILLLVVFQWIAFASAKKEANLRKPTNTATTDDDPSSSFNPNVTEHWFETNLDHFSFRPLPDPTFPLRYFVNDQYHHNQSSPVLFYAGNEADILLWECAQELGALIVFAEHRYYGKSFPFGGNPAVALTPDNISYLTVEQAMADYNTLQLHIRQKFQLHDDAAFLAVGGSYGANLALWLRLKNPNLWAGALASSATPQKHLLRETNAFHQIIAEVYGNVSTICPARIRQGWWEVLLNADSHEGRAELLNALQLCWVPNPSVGKGREIALTIHGWVSAALETMVQYGYPYPTSFYNPVPAYPFRVACEAILRETSGMAALKAAAQVYYNYSGQAGECFDWFGGSHDDQHYWKRLGQLDRIRERHSWTDTDDDDNYQGDDDAFHNSDYVGMAWGYQSCTEAYQPMPTDGVTDFELPHQVNETEYFERCRKQWNGVTPRKNWEEITFMGGNIQSGSNIFLTSGQLDPWRAAGIQSVPKGSPDSIVVRIIENGAHHLDLRSSHPLDPPSVVEVRKEELQAMRAWIQEWQNIHEVRIVESTTADT